MGRKRGERQEVSEAHGGTLYADWELSQVSTGLSGKRKTGERTGVPEVFCYV